jgi:hypothetical protein
MIDLKSCPYKKKVFKRDGTLKPKKQGSKLQLRGEIGGEKLINIK